MLSTGSAIPMTNQDKAQQPDQDAQELTDEDLDQANGGRVTFALAAGVDGELKDTTVEGTRLPFMG